MAGTDTCYNALRGMAEFDDVKDKELQAIVDKIDDVKKLAEAKGFSWREQAFKEIETLRRQTIQEKLRKITQAIRNKENFNSVKTHKQGPLEGVMALLNGTQDLSTGAVDSVYNREKYLKESNSSIYQQGLAKLDPRIQELHRSGALDKEVYIEMERMQKSDSKLADTGSNDAKEIAKVQVMVNNKLRDDISKGLGYEIGNVTPYITKQVHDRVKVRGEGESADMNKWIDDIFPRLDKEETFGAAKMADAKFMRDQLEGSWRSIVYGERAFEGYSRSLHFINAEHAYEYNLDWGNKNLFAATESRIRDNARITSQMAVLGPNPRQGLDTLKERISKSLREDEPKFRDFQSKWYKAENLMDQLEGRNTYPGDSTMAKIGRVARNLNNLTFMPNTAVRIAAHNVANGAFELQAKHGLSAFETATKMAELTAGRLKGIDKESMVKAGMYLQEHSHQVAELFGRNDAPDKTQFKNASLFMRALDTADSSVSKLSDGMFKWTGSSYLRNVDRATFSKMDMNLVHDKADLSWGELPKQFQANLNRANIDHMDWDVLRTAKDEMSSGHPVISPEALRGLDLDHVSSILDQHDYKPVSPIMEDPKFYLKDLEEKYGSYLFASQDMVNGHGDARQHSMMNHGYSEDTGMGQVLRLVGQFKSYSLFRYNTLMRFALADPSKDAVNIAGMLKGKGSNGAVAAYLASSALLWTFSQQLINLGTGKPLDKLDGDLAMRAMLKSGAGGVFGDMLDSEMGHQHTRTGIASYMAGPTIGRASDIVQLSVDAARGQNVSKKATSVARNLLPFQNAILIKPLIYDSIREQIDPNYAYNRNAERYRNARSN